MQAFGMVLAEEQTAAVGCRFTLSVEVTAQTSIRDTAGARAAYRRWSVFVLIAARSHPA